MNIESTERQVHLETLGTFRTIRGNAENIKNEYVMGSMSHWPIENGENDVKDVLSFVREVLFCFAFGHMTLDRIANCFWSHDSGQDCKYVLGSFFGPRGRLDPFLLEKMNR